MKKKELADLRSKKPTDLVLEADRARLEIIKAAANVSVSKEKNLKKVKNLRHDLAQTLSLIREKQIVETSEDISPSGKEGGKEK